MVGRTRVHLDHVQGLGQFMELEVVLEAGESTARGMQQAESLMQQLGIRSSQLIEGSYFDLLARRTPLYSDMPATRCAVA